MRSVYSINHRSLLFILCTHGKCYYFLLIYRHFRWSSILSGVRHDQDVLDKTGWHLLPQTALGLNVLMFGFDSLSKNTFIRKLPKSYEYFKDQLHGTVLQGYNIVGDGTPQALIPILTGKRKNCS